EEGADSLFGDSGNDTMHGGADNDTMRGGADDDVMYGDGGNDLMYGDGGSDKMHGGAGNDTMIGGADNDSLRGGDDDDHISGGTGDDTVVGDSGHDLMFGNEGNDLLVGGTGNDEMFGNADNDTLLGGNGSDTIMGGSGDDTIQWVMNANAGAADIVEGEIGNDTLELYFTAAEFAAHEEAIAKFANEVEAGGTATLNVAGRTLTAGSIENVAVIVDGVEVPVLLDDVITTDEDTDITAEVITGQAPTWDQDFVPNDGDTIFNAPGAVTLTMPGQAAVIHSGWVETAVGSNIWKLTIAGHGELTFDATNEEDVQVSLDITPIGSATDGSSAFDVMNTSDQATLVFDYTASISGSPTTETATVTINVDGTNDAAVISGTTSGSVTEDDDTDTVGGSLNSADVDNPDDLFLESSGTSANGYGTFTMTTAGVWEYTLDNSNPTVDDLNNFDSLTDSFVVYSADGTPQTITIAINGTNDEPNVAPIAADDFIVTNASAFTIAGALLTANDTDANGDQLAVSDAGALNSITSVSNGDVLVSNVTGSDLIGYEVTDGDETDTAIVAVFKQTGSTIEGTPDDNILIGTDGADVFIGGEGNDTIVGGSGGGGLNDVLDGGDGTDTAYYGHLSDGISINSNGFVSLNGQLIESLGSIENIIGTSGDDFINYGDYTAFGGGVVRVDNHYDGGEGNDAIYSETGNDTLYGGEGNDTLGGEGDDDLLYGEEGNDQLFGGSGLDTLHGGVGNDYLDGSLGNDVLDGGAGDDTLNGSNQDDQLTGGIGADTFLYTSIYNGDDTVTDFDIAEGDTIDLDSLFDSLGIATADRDADVILTDTGTDTVLTVDGQSNFSITLEGVDLDVVDETALRAQINVSDES
ncbi:type I secretion C-terminal target domain-containing protein, partial [Sneathiella sp. P13V-1]|uniref:VCBS domain-containing protein n=1 Tax=Sneathiella sp. P13V-1 TaxID=2697366 RepID=UPI00187B195B